MTSPFERPVVARIREALGHRKQLLQIVIGPRQTGKTTAAQAVAEQWKGPTRYAAADVSPPPGPEWIQTQWELARSDARKATALLVLDEVQMVRGWSEAVKACWDDDRRHRRRVQVLLLGSSALLLTRGANESLAGRFYLHRCLHWSYEECRVAFGWSLDTWIYYGGYPGAAPLVRDHSVWRNYILDSLIETVLARDVLGLQTVTKPTLLRHLFGLAAELPAQSVSYTKMLGQLQDAGNTVTLAHYLRLLESAFLVSGLERFSAGKARVRGSSPKLIFWNNALVTAPSRIPLREARKDAARWGRLVENAVGAHLLNRLQSFPYEITWWRDRHDEVDFVVRGPRHLWALEVKSGRPGALRGMEAFLRKYPEARPLLVGEGGMALEEFFRTDPGEILT